jgi:hypothetical protein
LLQKAENIYGPTGKLDQSKGPGCFDGNAATACPQTFSYYDVMDRAYLSKDAQPL